MALYAELDEHGAGRGGEALHPHVRGAVRRLERLREIDRITPTSTASENKGRTDALAAPQRAGEGPEGL